MRSEFLPFSDVHISEDDIEAIGEVLRSGKITTGPNSTLFENKFSEFVGCKNSVSLASATAGMHLILHAFNIGPGDEVITPSMTFISTINQIVLAGATPVFADVDQDTLMVTADTIREVITDKTKMIVPVHFAGLSVDMDPILELAREKKIPVIEDSAQALGTRYKGENIGVRGTSIFSFHPSKNITTIEGGMLCSDDDELVERIRLLKFHGLPSNQGNPHVQGRAPKAEVIEPGFKYTMTEISSVLGLNQLARIEEYNRKRTELAERYCERLSKIEEIIPLKHPEYDMGRTWSLFIVRLDIEKAGMNRSQFMKALKDRNIGTGLHFQAAHLQDYYRKSLNPEDQKLPHTEWNSERVCSLPLFATMTLQDVDDVVDAIEAILSGKNHTLV